MKRFTLVVFSALCLAQKPAPIKPDGITKTTVTHRVDLSACDVVKIELPLQKLDVHSGVVDVYGFKKYGGLPTITCEILMSPLEH